MCFISYADDRPFPRAGAIAQYGPDRPVRVRHLALHLHPDLEAKRIDATATLTVEAIVDDVAAIVLDAVDLDVKRVYVDGAPLAYRSRARTLDVTFRVPLRAGERTTFRIDYAVIAPRRGVYFTGPDRGDPQKPVQL